MRQSHLPLVVHVLQNLQHSFSRRAQRNLVELSLPLGSRWLMRAQSDEAPETTALSLEVGIGAHPEEDPGLDGEWIVVSLHSWRPDLVVVAGEIVELVGGEEVVGQEVLGVIGTHLAGCGGDHGGKWCSQEVEETEELGFILSMCGIGGLVRLFGDWEEVAGLLLGECWRNGRWRNPRHDCDAMSTP